MFTGWAEKTGEMRKYVIVVSVGYFIPDIIDTYFYRLMASDVGDQGKLVVFTVLAGELGKHSNSSLK